MKRILIPALVYAMPAIVLAEEIGSGLGDYLGSIVKFIENILVPLLIAFAILMFIWGVVQYFILGANDEEKRSTGRMYIIWGLVGFVVIVALTGIINFLADATGLNTGGSIKVPDIPGVGKGGN